MRQLSLFNLHVSQSLPGKPTKLVPSPRPSGKGRSCETKLPKEFLVALDIIPTLQLKLCQLLFLPRIARGK